MTNEIGGVGVSAQKTVTSPLSLSYLRHCRALRSFERKRNGVAFLPCNVCALSMVSSCTDRVMCAGVR
eukprot:360591-Chlamydomonas_euryale.AAC.16